MARFGFVGPSYTPYSISADSQRTANLYPERVESEQGKNRFVLYGTPGLLNFAALVNVAIAGGGAGYSTNDILTVVGGTGTAMTLRVTSQAAGVINGIAVETSGYYSVRPTDPVSVTGGTGTGATFTLNFANEIVALYYEQVTKRIFAVARLENSTIRLFELTIAGAQTDRGQLSATVGTLQPASISSNGLQLLIVLPEMLTAFSYTLATNALVEETADIGNTNPVWGQFLDQYFIALCDNGSIYISALLDGTTWDVLDTAKAESSPDITRMIQADHGELWQFGDDSIEVWFNSGAADFPFEPIKGSTIQHGILYKYSVAALDNSLFFAGRGADGGFVIWRTDGYGPQRVSNHAVERSIHALGALSSKPVAWAYKDHGHSFYVLTFPGNNLTWVYDATTGMWHERSYLNGSTEEAHRGYCHVFVGGEDGATAAQLVGDRANGRIYKMDLSYLDDFGNAIRRERRAIHLADEQKRIFYKRLQLEIEAAAGAFTLEYSNDGGGTFSSAITGRANFSNAGRVWDRLGSARDRVFRIRSTASIKHAWMDAYLDLEPGKH